MREIQGELCHNLLTKSIKPILSFDEQKNYAEWKKQIKEKLFDLVGIDNIKRNECPLNLEIESEVQKEGYKQIRFTFESERGAFVPCYLLIPDGEKKKYPVAIVLQGHSTGVHNAIGEPRKGVDEDIDFRKQFAVQAVKRGYVALAIEQRGMGETRPNHRPDHKNANMCEYTSHIALLLGRTIIGERMWDIHKAIDALATFDCADMDDITLTGNSGGGTTSYYAACLDERITLSAPSCSFCSYETSILSCFHCSCNFIPRAYEWFEMQDLACLIAPRKLLVIAGQEDTIFPIDGVRKSYERVQNIFDKANVADRCRLVETPMGHWWCEDLVWENIAKMRTLG